MTKGRRFLSLRFKFIVALAFSLLIALGAGALAKLVGDSYIQLTYMSQTQTETRIRQIFSDFQQFVEGRGLDVHNAIEITRWAKSQNHIYLLVYKDDRVIIDSGWWDEQEYYTDYSELDTEVQGSARMADASEDGMSFGYGVGSAPIAFQDGEYTVTVYDFSEEPLYEGVQIASYAMAILLFIFLLMFYHSQTIKRIIRLSQEVEVIAGGQLEEPIARQPADELGALAQHVDTMRFSIINEMRAEQEAWNANSDLITRMSHDIRTPLTVLLGFLELLDEGGYSEEETYRNYLGICKKNAFQLKSLADKLFQYFLVFGHREYEMELEVTDAHVLLEQLIGEHVAWLTERGWQVDVHPLGGSALIEVDTVCMKRLFDNLFSNIEKYADSAQPVVIRQWVAEEKLYVTLSNQIAQSSGQVESTNIGLKTCERIMQLMGGTFRTCRTEETFRAEAVLPLYREPEAEEMPALPAGDS